MSSGLRIGRDQKRLQNQHYVESQEAVMGNGGWYNGYSWPEREAKMNEMKRKLACGELEPASGPCALCGDPDVPVEYHDEDYSKPYLWAALALFALCRNCHRDKLHKRFGRPGSAWGTFIAHVRRGGYARDLKDPQIKKELAAYRAAKERGESLSLRALRPYTRVAGEEWFANLRLDPQSLSDPSARPRP